jgi:hypothetical protein
MVEITDRAGSALGIVKTQIRADLKRFKDYIENEVSSVVGGWRGEVESPPRRGL